MVCDTKEEALDRVQGTLKLLIKWFLVNLMNANIDKFQFMLLCPTASENKQTHVVRPGDVILSSQEGAKLLGVYIDRRLSFNTHKAKICQRKQQTISP